MVLVCCQLIDNKMLVTPRICMYAWLSGNGFFLLLCLFVCCGLSSIAIAIAIGLIMKVSMALFVFPMMDLVVSFTENSFST